MGSSCVLVVFGLLQAFMFNYAFGNDANSTEAFTWCPKNHQQVIKKGIPFQLCQPMSCAEMTGKRQELPENATVFQKNSTRYECKPFTSTFFKCQKVFLDRHQYASGPDYSLRTVPENVTIPLGNYFLEQNRATICASELVAPEGQVRAPLPEACMPFPVPQDGYTRKPNNTIFVNSVKSDIAPGFYKAFANGSVDTVCHQTDYEVLSCEGVSYVGSDEMSLLPDMSLHTTFAIEVVYPIGQYIMSEDGAFALVCIQKEKVESTSDIYLYMYGVASLISAICLLLALLAHLFFPRLNYHTKALLCLAFSLLVMYVVICVRNFTDTVIFDLTSNIVIFAVQYIFSLSAFLWLNVLAFDLWRVFSNVQGPVSPEASQRKGRRWFIFKCTYAYGISTLLCMIAIGISFNENLQRLLNIPFDFEHHNWLLRESLTILALFYGPVLVILLVNAIFFGLTIKNIKNASSGTDILHKDNSARVQLLKVYIKLFVIMGLSWFAEVISWFARKGTDEKVWYASDLINCLQGVLIFLVYVCKKKTITVIKQRFHMITIKGDSNTSKSTPLTTPKSRKKSNNSETSVYKSTDTIR